MLDKRTSVLLNGINELCTEGSFKIVEEQELVSLFPKKYAMDGDGVRRMLVYLKDNRYIELKYADEGVYCLCPLPEGRLYFERAREQRSDTFRRRRDIVLMTAIGAFAGAFLGGIAAWLLVSLL